MQEFPLSSPLLLTLLIYYPSCGRCNPSPLLLSYFPTSSIPSTVSILHPLCTRWVDLRTPANQSIFRIQSGVCQLFREFLSSKGFIEVIYYENYLCSTSSITVLLYSSFISLLPLFCVLLLPLPLHFFLSSFRLLNLSFFALNFSYFI